MTPRVDVIMPVYRGGRWLPETLRSLDAQTYRSWRLVVVDDACPEQSGDLVERLVPNALVVRLAVNGGPAAARAEAVRRSDAPLLALLDQDDLWDPTKLERQIVEFDRSPMVKAVHTDGRLIDGAGGDLGLADTNARRQLRWESGTRRDLARAQFAANRFLMSSTMIDRETWVALGGQSDAYGGEDWGFWFRFLAKGHRAAHIPEPLLLWRRHDANTSYDSERDLGMQLTRRRLGLRYAHLLEPRQVARLVLRR